VKHLGLLLCVLSSGCFDLQLPPAPGVGGPGVITGRVVWQRPGRLSSEGATGASLFLLGTNLGTTAKTDGRFVLEGIPRSEGTLLIRFDADGDGVSERQRTFSLADLGAARGRSISLGDVSMSQPSVVTGRVLRGDVLDAMGHGGTPVFVPGLPLATLTLADASFTLEGVVEGPVQLAAVRTGYEAWVSSTVSVRGGEELRLAPSSLVPTRAAVSGVLSGRVVSVEGAPLSGVTVRAGAATASTDAEGRWRFTGLPVDRYDVLFSATGRLPAALYNVLVAGPDELIMPDVVLAEGTAATTPSLVNEVLDEQDAGTPADAGNPDTTVIIDTNGRTPVLTLNETMQLFGKPAVGVTATSWEWAVSPSGAVKFDDATLQNPAITAQVLGAFTISVRMTVGSMVGTNSLMGRVELKDAGVAVSDAGGINITDSGITALSVWFDTNEPITSVSGLSLSGATGSVRLNGARGRISVVFDSPPDAGTALTVSVGSVVLADGGVRSLPPRPFLAVDFNFNDVELTQGNVDFQPGVAYLPTGPVVTGMLKGGTNCVEPCFFAKEGSGSPTTLSVTTDAGLVSWRRAVAAGEVVQAWLTTRQSFQRDRLTGVWAPATTPPGPTFSDGPTLRAVGNLNSNSLLLWDQDSGGTWTSNQTFSPPLNVTDTLVTAAGSVSFPGRRLAVAVASSGAVRVFQQLGTPPGSWGEPMGLNTVMDAQRGWVAASAVHDVLAINTPTGPRLYGLAGATPTWGPITTWARGPTAVVLDLVAAGSVVYALTLENSRLQLWRVPPNLAPSSIPVPAPSVGCLVSSAELTVSDFGDLAIASSEGCNSDSVFQLHLRELAR
jgi:hypothetical protein